MREEERKSNKHLESLLDSNQVNQEVAGINNV